MRIEKLLLLVTTLSLSLYFWVAIPTSVAGKDSLLNVKYTHLTESAREEVKCLADNIYWESAYEPVDGRVAVALVTLNRVKDDRFPKNICSVVKQKVRSTCQFSWWCETKHQHGIQDVTAYQEALKIALYVYVNYEKLSDITKGALFYHATYIDPRWRGLEKTTTIGRHIFYKQKDNYDAEIKFEARGRSVTPLLLLADGRN